MDRRSDPEVRDDCRRRQHVRSPLSSLLHPLDVLHRPWAMPDSVSRTGWVGFGVSANGGMYGAAIALYRQNGSGFILEGTWGKREREREREQGHK